MGEGALCLLRMDAGRLIRSNFLSPTPNLQPVIYTGDLNVAHLDLDCHSPSTNHKSAGFTPQERARFRVLLKAGFVDAYRMLYGDSKPGE